ncbi:hypothetical protein, partial [Foetidibacter luteolus]|uniref:hypothetical protein n=1 Tax=Foetidibacter luteolus TaxID=2608880 RepID=UPI001A982E0C
HTPAQGKAAMASPGYPLQSLTQSEDMGISSLAPLRAEKKWVTLAGGVSFNWFSIPSLAPLRAEKKWVTLAGGCWFQLVLHSFFSPSPGGEEMGDACRSVLVSTGSPFLLSPSPGGEEMGDAFRGVLVSTGSPFLL